MPNALSTAVRMLSQREYSAHTLKQKLRQKGVSSEEAEAAVTECQSLGLQSDERYAEVLVRSKANRGYGPLVIRQYLREACVEESLITTALQAYDEHVNWMDEAKRARDKKFRNQDAPQLKQKQFLRYRGFSEEMIRPLFD